MSSIAEFTEENYETRRVSSFLDWAHRRLNQEIKDIEEMEAEYGTAEWVKKPLPNNGKPAKPVEEMREIVKRIHRLRDEGYSGKEALAEVNIAKATYHRYRDGAGFKRYQKKGVQG